MIIKKAVCCCDHRVVCHFTFACTPLGFHWKLRPKQCCLSWAKPTNQSTLRPLLTSHLDQSHSNEGRTVRLRMPRYPTKLFISLIWARGMIRRDITCLSIIHHARNKCYLPDGGQYSEKLPLKSQFFTIWTDPELSRKQLIYIWNYFLKCWPLPHAPLP